MKLTVLGNYGPFPKAGGACSGFLIDDGSAKVLLDCGSGVLSRMQQYIDIEELSAIILTHLHSDHMGDIMILRYAADIKLKRGQLEKGITVYAPPEPSEEFARLAYKDAIIPTAIDPTKSLKIGEMTFRFREMQHAVQNFAISVETKNKKFVYSGDTSPTPALIEFAKGADLFLCEAGLLERDEKSLRAMHLTAREAGSIAAQAGAKRLLLTHFLPGIKIEQYMGEVAQVYNGIMEIAGENKNYFI